jgi:SAM-dependent methyltransferase
MVPQLTDYPRYAFQLVRGERTRGERDLAERRATDLRPFLDLDARPCRILDLANGRLRPQYTILRARGHQVAGVDLVNRPLGSWKDHAYRLARALHVRRLGVRPAAASAVMLASADVGRLPFPDASFDLVTSVAAFEHFLDVPAVIAEVRRVLKPGGMIWAAIHVFTALSGGHNLSFAEVPLRRVPPGVEPWDHLRSRRLPFRVPLNQWRIHQYLAAFRQELEVVSHYCPMREGEHLLTPSIEQELAGYTRDELTAGAYIIVGRRPRQDSRR